jgi:hypothetical protein
MKTYNRQTSQMRKMVDVASLANDRRRIGGDIRVVFASGGLRSPVALGQARATRC